MEVLKFSKNVWGQEMLIGVSWDILWLPIVAAAVFILVHQVLRVLSRQSQGKYEEG